MPPVPVEIAGKKGKKKKRNGDDMAPGQEDEGRQAVGDDGLGDADDTATYTIRMLLQTRYQLAFPDITQGLVDQVSQSFTDPSFVDHNLQLIRESARANDGLSINRAFLRLTVRPNDVINGKLLIDFAELLHKNQKRSLKLAYVEITPNDTFAIYAGLFKIPFSLLELLPIADFELADVGPTDELIKDLGFGGRDIGVMIDVAPLRKKKWLHINVGAFQGDNNGPQDFRGPGILAARLILRPNKHFRFGIDGVWRPRAVADWGTGTRVQKYDGGRAASADLTVAFKKFELRSEAMLGDRTDLGPTAGLIIWRRPEARTFFAAWALATMRFVLNDNFTLMPAARAEWLDEEREVPIGRSIYLTGGLNLDYQNRLRLLLDVSRLWIDPGTPDRSLLFIQFRSNNTLAILQLQLKI